MGACFGRCLTGEKGICLKLTSSNDDQFNNLVGDENKLHDNNESLVFRIMKTKSQKHSKFTDRFWTYRELNNYSRLNKANTNPPTISTDIQLQCLDAHSLLIAARDRTCGYNSGMYTGLTGSPAGSSLDLEWEHEYHSNPNWSIVPEEITPNGGLSSEDDCSSNNSELHKQTKKHKNFNTTPTNNLAAKRFKRHHPILTNNSSVNSWSNISTPTNSMEWDVDDQENHFKSEDSLDQETKDLLYEIEQLKNRVLSETGPPAAVTSNECPEMIES